MRKLFGLSERLAGCSGTSELGRKPALGLSAVLMVLGMGLGVDAWAQKLACDMAKKSIEMPSTIFDTANADLLKSCPELRSQGGMTYEQAREYVSFARYGIFGCYEDNKVLIEKLRDKSLAFSKWYVTKDASATCQAFLARELGLSDAGVSSGGVTSSTQNSVQKNASTQIQTNPLQSQTQESQQRARDAQVRADAAAQRNGKRVNDPAAQAHQCIDVDFASLYGGFKNKCDYAVSYGYCVENPRSGVLTDSPLFDCARMKPNFTGGGSIKGNGYDTNHTKGGVSVQFFACKQPAYATDLTYVLGKGIEGRCVNF